MKLFLICSTLLWFNATAQQSPCAFDELRKMNANNRSDFKLPEERANRVLYERAQLAEVTGSLTVYQVPVVVHIISYNGMGNLTDPNVQSAINTLNLRFQNAPPYTDPTGHAVNIQFCLASVDPQGYPTTGITRDTSLLTFLNASDDLQLKNLNRWDPKYYYNIWTVSSISGFNISVSGYSSLPSSAGSNTDGVVMYYGAMQGTTLTHESGHYMGLYHTFEGMDCNNLNCLLNGDHVCDTPPDTSTGVCMGNSCPTEMQDTSGFNPFTGDENDLPNYMDYTSCAKSFSQGQAVRMENALTLLRSSLLQSAGCGFSGGPAPVAHLGYLISNCNDGMVSFADSLSTNATTVNWDFDNNGVYDSHVHNPTYTFPATGTYMVKLLVVGQGGVDSVYQTIFVQKSPALYYPIESYGGVFTNHMGGLNSCQDFNDNFTSAPAQSYLWSTGATTQSISFNPVTTFTLTLTIVDNNGLTWTNAICHPLIVNVNPLPPVPLIYTNDSLSICDGEHVTFHSIVNGSGSYIYNWYENSSYLQNAHDSVYTATGYFPGITYQLIIGDTNYCYNYSNIIYVYSYSPPAVQSLTQNGYQLISGWGGGNQWYWNDVAIPGASGTTYNVTQPGCYEVAWYFSFAPRCYTMSDTICFTTIGINEVNAEAGLPFIYPVPAKKNIIIELNAASSGSYSISEPSGRLVMSGKLATKTTVVDVAALAGGIYFIQLTSGEKHFARKIVKE